VSASRSVTDQPAATGAEPSTGITVRAVKVVLDDGGRRVVVGQYDRSDGGRWWCEEHGLRPCAHLKAAREHVAAGDVAGKREA
jgi:hypothetical protein